MRISLFGRILLAFWATLIVLTMGLWFMYAADWQRNPLLDRRPGRTAAPLISLVAQEVRRDGVDEARQAVGLLPSPYDRNIRIIPADQLPRHSTGIARIVTQPVTGKDGVDYVILYTVLNGHSPFDIPLPIFLTGAAAGLIVSFLLARYLSRPIMLLREGFGQMARGELDFRLSPRIKQRSDEIYDLAHDFDRMAERLKHLLDARERLLHDVSHEIRSPLTRLQLAIGLARQSSSGVEDSLERIEREAEKLDAMVQELLQLARAENGLDREHGYFDPVALVESVVADAMFEAKAARVDILADLPEVDEELRPNVVGDAELLRRAVENVVRNAIRFSPPDASMTVHVAILEEPTRYRLAVLDRGPGVSPDMIEHIFDPFVRGAGSGAGLGLSIAKRAILAHGGTISATNRRSKGLRVVIEVPAQAAAGNGAH